MPADCSSSLRQRRHVVEKSCSVCISYICNQPVPESSTRSSGHFLPSECRSAACSTSSPQSSPPASGHPVGRITSSHTIKPISHGLPIGATFRVQPTDRIQRAPVGPPVPQDEHLLLRLACATRTQCRLSRLALVRVRIGYERELLPCSALSVGGVWASRAEAKARAARGPRDSGGGGGGVRGGAVSSGARRDAGRRGSKD